MKRSQAAQKADNQIDRAAYWKFESGPPPAKSPRTIGIAGLERAEKLMAELPGTGHC
jgi:hypothetical protein